MLPSKDQLSYIIHHRIFVTSHDVYEFVKNFLDILRSCGDDDDEKIQFMTGLVEDIFDLGNKYGRERALSHLHNLIMKS